MAVMPSPTVPAEWLLEHQQDPELCILDVRWSLASGAETAAYGAGHIPGAVFLDLDRDLAGRPGSSGRHPLPDPAQFGESMRRAGVSSRSSVVAYDEVTGAAARAWWLLQAAGHPRVGVLDGGLRAYLEAGGILSPTLPRPAPGNFRATGFKGAVPADLIPELQQRGYLVLDARAHDRYSGSPNPLDPRPGHIPKATSLPWTELYQGGRQASPDEAGRRLQAAAHRGQPIIAYCGSGVTACALLLALEAAGVQDLHLYPGSWSEWAADETRPVEIGP
ncbi:MAG: sulfurtransferase [Candidatus Dormibacteria bacterium]